MKRAWLQGFTWAVIVETNRQLCLPKGALHQRTSDGYEPTRELWESLHRTQMTLAEATDLCRRCHRLAPFCNFNGNTFLAAIRRVIGDHRWGGPGRALRRRMRVSIPFPCETPGRILLGEGRSRGRGLCRPHGACA